jgi:hypothetical protein
MQFQPALLPCCYPRDDAANAHAQTQSLHGAHCWCARRCYHGPARPLPNQVALSYRLSMLAPGHPAYRGTTKHHVLRIRCRRLNNSCGALSPLPAGYRYRRSAAQEVGTDVAAGRSPLAGSQQHGSSPACPAYHWRILGSVSSTRVRGPGGHSAPGCSRLQRRERPSSKNKALPELMSHSTPPASCTRGGRIRPSALRRRSWEPG